MACSDASAITRYGCRREVELNSKESTRPRLGQHHRSPLRRVSHTCRQLVYMHMTLDDSRWI
eukprot:9227265-Pyramimonas_sp.AAC.1